VAVKTGEKAEQEEWIGHKLAAQNGCCGICGRSFGNLVYVVDHDHNHCKKRRGCRRCWRGLLCERCNWGLGLFGDSIRILAGAIVYLQDHGGGSTDD
jgi:hypothetical protein